MKNETVWLSTSQMAELFGRDKTVITSHINNCFKEGELDRNITCAKFAQVQSSNDVYFCTLMEKEAFCTARTAERALPKTPW